MANPDQYATWLKIVTQPFNLVPSVGVAALAMRMANFQGRYGGPNIDGPMVWTGLVQDTSGFFPYSGYQNRGGFPLAGLANSYVHYAGSMYNVSASCPNGQYCSTSFWGGIGGYPVSFLGSPYSTPLIQSGIWYSNFGQPMGPRLFVEYLSSDNMTGAPVYLQLSNQYFSLNFAVNDEIYVSGWSSPNQNCNGMDSSGGWGCFWFWDVTQGWYTNGPQQQFPGGNPFVGATAEWIAEVANIGYLTSVGTPTSNATYVVQGMDGMGYDPGGNGHTAQAGDPYILVEQAEFLPNAPADHNEFNYVTFSTFGQSYADYQPQAWVYFYFQNNL